jgi:hypothetical protein
LKTSNWRKVRTPAAALAAGVVLFLAVLPPAPRRLETSGWTDLAARTIPGAYHIHTTRSDGVGDRTAVARAASRAGLKFVILTDHGDGTRPPDPPEYIDSVLCLDAVEISTDEGHYIALDMPRAPYPLGGAADAVIEDVHRLGGFGIAAHPDSPKPSLRWSGGDAQIDGIEWLNADSEWRKDSRTRLVRAGVAYFFRPGPALAALLDRPSTLDRWDRLTADRRVVGLAGVDAHGGVSQRSEDPSRSLTGAFGLPGYEASFRTFSTRVVVDRPLAGNAAEDGRAIYAAVRKGSVFTAIDALAAPGLLDFRSAGAALEARATMSRGSEIVLLEAGREVARSTGNLRYDIGQREGAFRVEVRTPDAPGNPPIPWIVSNPIYLGARFGAVSSEAPAGSTGPVAAGRIPPFPWRIEKDSSSSGILRSSDHRVALQYKLGEGARRSQFVALASDITGAFDGIDLGLAADRPTRVSVQVRAADGRRWGRSFYVDPAGTRVHAALRDLRQIAGAGSLDPASVTSILLVIDLTNAAPGHGGSLEVLSSALVK